MFNAIINLFTNISANNGTSFLSLSLGSMIFNLIKNAVTMVINFFLGIIWIVLKWFLGALDACQMIVTTLMGIDTGTGTEMTVERMFEEFKFIHSNGSNYYDILMKTFRAVSAVALILMIIFTVLAMIMQDYNIAVKQEYKPANNDKWKIVKNLFTNILMVMLMPLTFYFVLTGSNAILTSFYRAIGNDVGVSIGGKVLASATYDANRYRTYANNNKRVPIIIKAYESSASNNEIKSDKVQNKLKAIAGAFANNSFLSFKKSTAFNGGLQFDGTTFRYNDVEYQYGLSEKESKEKGYGYLGEAVFENFICTQEQYYIMAEFVDYCQLYNIPFYIKAIQEADISWKYVDSAVVTTTGPLQTDNQTFTEDSGSLSMTIKYRDAEMVNGANKSNESNTASALNGEIGDGYSLTFTTDKEIVSPIADAMTTVSTLLGIDENAVMYNAMERDDSGDYTNLVSWANEKALLQFSQNFNVNDFSTWTNPADQIILYEYYNFSSNNTFEDYTLDRLKSEGAKLDVQLMTFREIGSDEDQKVHCVKINNSYYRVRYDENDGFYKLYSITNGANNYFRDGSIQIEDVNETTLKLSNNFDINDKETWTINDAVLVYEYYSNPSLANDLRKIRFTDFYYNKIGMKFKVYNIKEYSSIISNPNMDKMYININNTFYEVEDIDAGASVNYQIVNGTENNFTSSHGFLVNADVAGKSLYEFSLSLTPEQKLVYGIPSTREEIYVTRLDSSHANIYNNYENLETDDVFYQKYANINLRLSATFDYNNEDTWTYKDAFIFYLYAISEGNTNVEMLQLNGITGALVKYNDTYYLKTKDLKLPDVVNNNSYFINLETFENISEERINETLKSTLYEKLGLDSSSIDIERLYDTQLDKLYKAKTEVKEFRLSDNYDMTDVSTWTVGDYYLSYLANIGIINDIYIIDRIGYGALVYEIDDGGNTQKWYKFGAGFDVTNPVDSEKESFFINSSNIPEGYDIDSWFNMNLINYLLQSSYFEGKENLMFNSLSYSEEEFNLKIYQNYINYIYEFDVNSNMPNSLIASFIKLKYPDTLTNISEYSYYNDNYIANDPSTWNNLDVLIKQITGDFNGNYSSYLIKKDAITYFLVGDRLVDISSAASPFKCQIISGATITAVELSAFGTIFEKINYGLSKLSEVSLNDSLSEELILLNDAEFTYVSKFDLSSNLNAILTAYTKAASDWYSQLKSGTEIYKLSAVANGTEFDSSVDYYKADGTKYKEYTKADEDWYKQLKEGVKIYTLSPVATGTTFNDSVSYYKVSGSSYVLYTKVDSDWTDDRLNSGVNLYTSNQLPVDSVWDATAANNWYKFSNATTLIKYTKVDSHWSNDRLRSSANLFTISQLEENTLWDDVEKDKWYVFENATTLKKYTKVNSHWTKDKLKSGVNLYQASLVSEGSVFNDTFEYFVKIEEGKYSKYELNSSHWDENDKLKAGVELYVITKLAASTEWNDSVSDELFKADLTQAYTELDMIIMALGLGHGTWSAAENGYVYKGHIYKSELEYTYLKLNGSDKNIRVLSIPSGKIIYTISNNLAIESTDKLLYDTGATISTKAYDDTVIFSFSAYRLLDAYVYLLSGSIESNTFKIYKRTAADSKRYIFVGGELLCLNGDINLETSLNFDAYRFNLADADAETKINRNRKLLQALYDNFYSTYVLGSAPSVDTSTKRVVDAAHNNYKIDINSVYKDADERWTPLGIILYANNLITDDSSDISASYYKSSDRTRQYIFVSKTSPEGVRSSVYIDITELTVDYNLKAENDVFLQLAYRVATMKNIGTASEPNFVSNMNIQEDVAEHFEYGIGRLKLNNYVKDNNHWDSNKLKSGVDIYEVLAVAEGDAYNDTFEYYIKLDDGKYSKYEFDIIHWDNDNKFKTGVELYTITKLEANTEWSDVDKNNWFVCVDNYKVEYTNYYKYTYSRYASSIFSKADPNEWSWIDLIYYYHYNTVIDNETLILDRYLSHGKEYIRFETANGSYYYELENVDLKFIDGAATVNEKPIQAVTGDLINLLVKTKSKKEAPEIYYEISLPGAPYNIYYFADINNIYYGISGMGSDVKQTLDKIKIYQKIYTDTSIDPEKILLTESEATRESATLKSGAQIYEIEAEAVKAGDVYDNSKNYFVVYDSKFVKYTKVSSDWEDNKFKNNIQLYDLVVSVVETGTMYDASKVYYEKSLENYNVTSPTIINGSNIETYTTYIRDANDWEGGSLDYVYGFVSDVSFNYISKDIEYLDDWSVLDLVLAYLKHSSMPQFVNGSGYKFTYPTADGGTNTQEFFVFNGNYVNFRVFGDNIIDWALDGLEGILLSFDDSAQPVNALVSNKMTDITVQTESGIETYDFLIKYNKHSTNELKTQITNAIEALEADDLNNEAVISFSAKFAPSNYETWSISDYLLYYVYYYKTVMVGGVPQRHAYVPDTVGSDIFAIPFKYTYTPSYNFNPGVGAEEGIYSNVNYLDLAIWKALGELPEEAQEYSFNIYKKNDNSKYYVGIQKLDGKFMFVEIADYILIDVATRTISSSKIQGYIKPSELATSFNDNFTNSDYGTQPIRYYEQNNTTGYTMYMTEFSTKNLQMSLKHGGLYSFMYYLVKADEYGNSDSYRVMDLRNEGGENSKIYYDYDVFIELHNKKLASSVDEADDVLKTTSFNLSFGVPDASAESSENIEVSTSGGKTNYNCDFLIIYDEIVADFDFEDYYYYKVNMSKLEESGILTVSSDLKASILTGNYPTPEGTFNLRLSFRYNSASTDSLDKQLYNWLRDDSKWTNTDFIILNELANPYRHNTFKGMDFSELYEDDYFVSVYNDEEGGMAIYLNGNFYNIAGFTEKNSSNNVFEDKNTTTTPVVTPAGKFDDAIISNADINDFTFKVLLKTVKYSLNINYGKTYTVPNNEDTISFSMDIPLIKEVQPGDVYYSGNKYYTYSISGSSTISYTQYTTKVSSDWDVDNKYKGPDNKLYVAQFEKVKAGEKFSGYAEYFTYDSLNKKYTTYIYNPYQWPNSQLAADVDIYKSSVTRTVTRERSDSTKYDFAINMYDIESYKTELVIKQVSWVEKLMTDMQVYYPDLNWSTLIATDGWIDTLGDYVSAFTTGLYVSDDNSSNVTAAGIVLSEFFISVATEVENSYAKYEYSSMFDKDTIHALMRSLMGVDNFDALKLEASLFMDFFNSTYAPILDDLAFEFGEAVDSGSLRMCVYKAFLATILLGSDIGEYLYTIATRVYSEYTICEYLAASGNDYAGYHSYVNGLTDENGEVVTAYTYGSFADLVSYENEFCGNANPTFSYNFKRAYNRYIAPQLGEEGTEYENITMTSSEFYEFLLNPSNEALYEQTIYSLVEAMNKDYKIIYERGLQIDEDGYIANSIGEVVDDSEEYVYSYMLHVYWSIDKATYINPYYVELYMDYMTGRLVRWDVLKDLDITEIDQDLPDYLLLKVQQQAGKLTCLMAMLKLLMPAVVVNNEDADNSNLLSTILSVVKGMSENGFGETVSDLTVVLPAVHAAYTLNDGELRDEIKRIYMGAIPLYFKMFISEGSDLSQFLTKGPIGDMFKQILSKFGLNADDLTSVEWCWQEILNYQADLNAVIDELNNLTCVAKDERTENGSIKKLDDPIITKIMDVFKGVKIKIDSYVNTQTLIDKIQKRSITFTLGQFGANYVSTGFSFNIKNKDYKFKSTVETARIAEYVYGGAFLEEVGEGYKFTTPDFTGIMKANKVYDSVDKVVKTELDCWSELRGFASGIADYTATLHYLTNLGDLSPNNKGVIKMSEEVYIETDSKYKTIEMLVLEAIVSETDISATTLARLILANETPDSILVLNTDVKALIAYINDTWKDEDYMLSPAYPSGRTFEQYVDISPGDNDQTKKKKIDAFIRRALKQYLNNVTESAYTTLSADKRGYQGDENVDEYIDGRAPTTASKIIHEIFKKVMNYMMVVNGTDNPEAVVVNFDNITFEEFKIQIIKAVIANKQYVDESADDNAKRYVCLFQLVSTQIEYNLNKGANKSYAGRFVDIDEIKKFTEGIAATTPAAASEVDNYAFAGLIISTNSGNKLVFDHNTEQSLCKLAGLENRPTWELVAENNDLSDKYALKSYDEAKGDTFILCTFDESTNLYVPILAKNKGLYSTDGYNRYVEAGFPVIETKYYSAGAYPIIAKGLITADGYPTAIRKSQDRVVFNEKKLFQEAETEYNRVMFYRTDIGAIGASGANFADISQTVNKVSTKNYTRFTTNASFTAGLTGTRVYTGKDNIKSSYASDFNANYIHFESLHVIPKADDHEAISILDDFHNYYLLGGQSLMLCILALMTMFPILLNAALGVMRRILDLLTLFLISPLTIAMRSMSDKNKSKAFEDWVKDMQVALFGCLGYIIGFSSYFILFDAIYNIDYFLSAETFNNISKIGGLSNFITFDLLNSILRCMWVLAGVYLIKGVPKLLLPIVSGQKVNSPDSPIGDGSPMTQKIKNIGNDIKKLAQKANAILSGKALMQMKDAAIQMAKDTIPGVKQLSDMGVGRSMKANKEGKEIEKALVAYGVDKDTAKDARKSVAAKKKAQLDKKKAKQDKNANEFKSTFNPF